MFKSPCIRKVLTSLFGVLVLQWGLPAGAATLNIATAQANLRTDAVLTASVADVAKRGEHVTPLGYSAGYAKVRRENGHEGWVHAASQGWSEADVRAAMTTTSVKTVKNAAVVPVVATTLNAHEAIAGLAPHPYSLAALGLKQGHYFEGARSIHSQVFYFPLPADGSAKAGVLRLHYRASGQLLPVSTLRVDVNDKPVRSTNLADREVPAWLEVPVTAEDLKKSALKVTVRASLVASTDRCFDERSLALFFVQLMPDSWLDLQQTAPNTSLRAAWSHLPAQVRISVPANVSESVYATALQTAVLLQQARRTVSIVQLPEWGDIVIAPEAELTQRFGAANFGAATSSASTSDKPWASVRVVRDATGRAVIALSDQLDPALLSREAPAWLGLLQASGYQAQRPSESPDEVNVIDLAEYGALSTQYVNRTVEWSMLLTPPTVPANKWLDTLRLNLVVPPESASGKLLLYVYLNGLLNEVRELDQDGKPHSQSFTLGRNNQRVGSNQLRIVVQRVAAEGNCQGDVAAFPVQILPGSVLALEDWNEKPARFNDLRAAFSKGPELWVSASSRQNLAREIGLITGLFANHQFLFDRSRLHFMADNADAFAPKAPFILLGQTTQAPGKVAVHLDRGRVEVVDGKRGTLLKLDHLPAITVAQLVEQGGQPGMWLAPAKEGMLPPPAEVFLDQDDVAFMDERGVVLTMDSHQHALSHAEYPDYFDWLDVAAQYRFWIIGLGWTLLVLFLLHLYRKSRKHAGH